MKKRLRHTSGPKRSSEAISWFPIDSRLFLPIFSFGHVHGLARFFLTVEILFAIGIVVGTFIIAALTLFR